MNLPYAKNIKIKRITNSIENFSEKLGNYKRNKFLYSDTLLYKKLSPYKFDEIENYEKYQNEDLKEFNKKKYHMKFVSENEFFFVENLSIEQNALRNYSDYQRFLFPFIIRDLDTLKGIYKLNFIAYKIVDIEYEDFDKLKEFIKDEKINKIYNTGNKPAFINAYYINEYTNFQIVNRSFDKISYSRLINILI
jgi:hypothetical protein